MSNRTRAVATPLLLAAAAAAAVSACLSSCSRGGSADSRNLVVVTIDTLRADRVGALARDGRSLTPELDRVAAEGARFTRAFSATNITNPSHLTIFSGAYPKNHAVFGNSTRAGGSLTTLAERLSEAGYATAGFVSAFHLQSLSGLERGFDAFPAPSASEVKGGEAVGRALEWLAARGADAAGKPFFLWVHLYDPHRPYVPPDAVARRVLPEDAGPVEDLEKRLSSAPNRERDAVAERSGVSEAEIRAFMKDWKKAGKGVAELAALESGPPDALATRVARAVAARRGIVGGSAWTEPDRAAMALLYDAEVASADRELGPLFAALRQDGLRETTHLVVTSDHGENLGDHGIFFNHRGIFDTTLHVPLSIGGPGIPAGTVIGEPAHHVDLVPTVLDLLGRPAARGADGVSLAPLVRREAAALAPRLLFHENAYEIARAVRDGRWKYVDPVPIEALSNRLRNELWHEEALFDTDADPGESADVAAGNADVRERLSRVLRGFRALAPRFPIDADSKTDLSPEIRERLRQLGYVY